MTGRASRAPLRVVPASGEPAPPPADGVSVDFCARCGRPPAASATPVRVCPHCQLGLVLRAQEQMAPTAEDLFLVVDRQLQVCALSERAQLVLDITEADTVGHPVTDLLEPVGRTGAELALLDALRDCLQSGSCSHTDVRLAGAAMTLRVGPCGPPRAALLVVSQGA